jgi:DNA-binding CsgD family transcriptional regulator
MDNFSRSDEANAKEIPEIPRKAALKLMQPRSAEARKAKSKANGRRPVGLSVESLVGSLALWREAQAMVAQVSPREIQVLVLVAHGLTTKEIGEVLSISPRTVDIHRARILVKTGARSTADTVRIAIYAALAGAGQISVDSAHPSAETGQPRGQQVGPSADE